MIHFYFGPRFQWTGSDLQHVCLEHRAAGSPAAVRAPRSRCFIAVWPPSLRHVPRLAPRAAADAGLCSLGRLGPPVGLGRAAGAVREILLDRSDLNQRKVDTLLFELELWNFDPDDFIKHVCFHKSWNTEVFIHSDCKIFFVEFECLSFSIFFILFFYHKKVYLLRQICDDGRAGENEQEFQCLEKLNVICCLCLFFVVWSSFIM